MKRRFPSLRSLLARLEQRLNPRLRPLLAAGIGLGLVALWLPSPAPDREAHGEEEILAGLTSSELDLAHGPRFWLRELRQDSELSGRARELCSEPPNPIRPGCQLLATLERIAAAEVPVPPTPTPPPPGGTP